jgi:hypothetical protein
MRMDSFLGATYAHCSQTLIAHLTVLPQEYTPSLSHRIVLQQLNLPCLGLQQQVRQKFSELCGIYRTPSRSSHFLRTLSDLERVSHRLHNLPLQPQPPPSPRESVSHRPDNLSLQPQPQPPPSPGESVAHMPDNLLLQLRSNTRRTKVRLSKEKMTKTNHTQPRDCVATTSHSYNTHDIGNYNMLKFHRRQQQK